jgi:uncharacterized glyoxalase superfamily protein PhnB
MTSEASHHPKTAVWPSLRYRDANAGIDFLEKAFGLVVVAVYRSDDGLQVDHAELAWPLGGGLMLGSERETADWPQHAGHAAVYLVTDDVAGLYERAVAAGATVTLPLETKDYGGSGFSVRDPEGNLWSFGDYAGESS